MNGRRLSTVMIVIMCAAAVLTGCGKSGSKSDDQAAASQSGASLGGTYYDYLGDLDYGSSISAMVYEEVEGEHVFGIQYRAVEDINGLIANGNTDLLLYFYSSLSSDVYGVTAGVEDLAQTLNGQLLVVAVNALDHVELCDLFAVQALPEFIIVRGGEEASVFEGYNYEYWTMDDVVEWIVSNGYTPDYDLIMAEG